MDFLELTGITRHFGDFAALKGVSLGVRQGELICFLGPSGCGKTTRKLDAAKKLMDWTATREANEAYAKNFVIVSHPAVKSKLPHIPSDLEKRLIKNDFAFAAKNRDKILAEWQKRYAAKTEAK